MTHVVHEELPGFKEDQVLVDGCPECEARGADPARAVQQLDPVRFQAAWGRAGAWGRERLDGRTSAAERPLLQLLFAVQLQFERLGMTDTFGLIAAWWEIKA
jgi:hypothetical protein